MNIIFDQIGLILNENNYESSFKKRVEYSILLLILISSSFIILESVDSINTTYSQLFIFSDFIISILFSIEYLLRIMVYKKDGELPTLKQRLSHFFSFYMLVDLMSILPFYLAFFIPGSYSFIKIIRILRLFRLVKFARFMKSQNLVANAIKNKAKELILSLQVVVFLTIILSAILYQIETRIQTEHFTSIVDAFIWSLSKFIGGVGGYGDFEPITFWGKVIATVVGLLGIALFAVPAGIIGAGFVEEIEAIKEDEDLKEKNKRLFDAFNYENAASAIKYKKLVGLSHIRRRFIGVKSAEFKLMFSRSDLINIAKKGKNIKLSFVDKTEVIQAYEQNSLYGTCKNIQSNLSIISPTSVWQPYMGHFTYALSEYLKANYISSELVGKSAWNPEYKHILTWSPNYLSGEKSESKYFEQFRFDLKEVVKEKSTVIYFNCSASKNGSFHVLNGGEKGKDEFASDDCLFEDHKKLDNFYESFQNELKNIDDSEEKIYSTINKHNFYGNNKKNHFQWMLKREKNANIICIYLSPKILEAPNEKYYSIIKILGDNINNHLI